MEPRKSNQEMTAASGRANEPRFRITKLEERIAPSHKLGHYPPGQGDSYYPPGHTGYGGGNCWRGGKWHGPCND